MIFQFSPYVQTLTINESQKKVSVHYLNKVFDLPFIGLRPPFYVNPQYQPHFPII